MEREFCLQGEVSFSFLQRIEIAGSGNRGWCDGGDDERINWADIFASTDLLGKYWSKLVRSCASRSGVRVEGNPITGCCCFRTNCAMRRNHWVDAAR
jgi:hypothetical protein